MPSLTADMADKPWVGQLLLETTIRNLHYTPSPLTHPLDSPENVESWNATINRYEKIKKWEKVLGLLQVMVDQLLV